MTEVVNLRDKLAAFATHWDPKIIGELNGQHVKLAKLQGEFVWHAHEHEDELFLVLEGVLEMRYRDRSVTVREGELVIVHMPQARGGSGDQFRIKGVPPSGPSSASVR